ncbi:hypothetical protein SAMN02745127_00820 [Oceanospirillum multiglobuliferum]|uniref:Uncharacterized protein n=1 Tax=Oceanospirillum multiglobuliferum TaxID=64969 RepID=A0A1T4ML30_9GAMM|nr:hypothetical protein [Oceanospirillum multiglobuliferum]OPX56985.1 hypothetical protein BTE48_00680 [Oceanospirillum multiglobuliferum]SJZ67525.1 hypothetical protein SAMN02745127_00820 [Oceanospirillum multiglobuliferum]
MSDSPFLEIVELADGDVILQSADDENGEPLVRIRFAPEIVEHLRGASFDIAREMLDKAIQDSRLWGEAGEDDVSEARTLH